MYTKYDNNINKSLKQILVGHRGAITCMSVDANGRTLFTGGADGVVMAWIIATGERIRVIVFMFAVSTNERLGGINEN